MGDQEIAQHPVIPAPPRPAGYSLRAASLVLVLDFAAKVVAAATGFVLVRKMSIDQFALLTIAVSARNLLNGVFAASFNRIYIVGYQTLGLGASAPSFMLTQIVLVLAGGVLLYPLVRTGLGIYLLILIWAVAQAIYEFARTDFQQRLEFRTYSRFELIRCVLLTILVLPLALMLSSRLPAGFVVIGQTLALLLAVLVLARKRSVQWWKGRKNQVTHQIRALFSSDYKFLFVYSILLVLISQIDVFTLRHLCALEQIAAYGSALQYYGLLLMALAAVTSVMVPTLQTLTTRTQIDAVFRKHNRILLPTAALFAIGTLVAGYVIPLVDKGRYVEAVPCFRILAWSAFFSLAWSPYAVLLARLEDFRFLMMLGAIVLAIALPLQFLLVQSHASVGAAIGTFLTFFLLNGSTWVRAAWLTRRTPLLTD